jgi:Cu-Zn family superoxide dismutase
MVMDKAVILHANPDDLVSQPSGNAGDRMACGLIKSL